MSIWAAENSKFKKCDNYPVLAKCPFKELDYQGLANNLLGIISKSHIIC